MNKNQTAKKYSKAIISSVEIQEVPQVVEELKAFSGLIDSHKQLRLLFAGKIFNEEEKEKAFEALGPALKLNPGTAKYLKLIIVQGHLPAISEIIEATINAYNESQKKATAVVVSSVALEKDYEARLREALKQMTSRDVTIENEVDGSLLGGFIVKMGSTIFDSSIKGQLRLLKSELMR